MENKMMFRWFLLGTAVLAVTACFSDLSGKNKYEANILVHYEPDYAYQLDAFLSEFFNGGKDTVSVNEYFTVGPATHLAKVAEDGSLAGGLALCIGADTVATPDRKPSRLAVFDKGGYEESLGYAVFHDTVSTQMPAHAVQFYIPNDESSTQPSAICVQNVQAVVVAAKYGVGLAGGPFTADDYLALTITGSLKGKATGSKTVKLVDGTRFLEGWTEVDLSSLGMVDALDYHLESSRPDCPLYACLDNLYFHYLEVY